MKHEEISLAALSPDFAGATLTSYIQNDVPEMKMAPRPAVLICPGGGYAYCSDREAEPIALAFLTHGFNAFILRYSVAPQKLGFLPLREAYACIRHIRDNAEAYNLQPDALFVCGFSAGGHLAGSVGVLADTPEVLEKIGEGTDHRPNGMILAYPVLTMGIQTHGGSAFNLCGEDESLKRFFSLETQVSNVTPPAFIWHTQDDTCVPVENSLLFAAALRRHGVPFEMHIYRHGPHGLSLANANTACSMPELEIPRIAGWIDHAAAWAKETLAEAKTK